MAQREALVSERLSQSPGTPMQDVLSASAGSVLLRALKYIDVLAKANFFPG